MNIDKAKKDSMRKAFGKALVEMGDKDNRIVVLDADLACSTQTKMFKDRFPERFFDCGIAEQDMLATAAGLAAEGKIPFAASFAVFATGRAYDQIRNGICYSNFNVKIIGTHGGITVGEDGATHQALEDISLMRGIPNMTVIVPSDCKECEEAVKYAAQIKGPVYIRISRGNVPNLFDDSYKFNANKALILKEGKDITVFTNGETTSEAIIAAQNLEKENISVQIVNVPVIKPIDTETIINAVKSTKVAITIENHSIIGGLGSAICEILSEKYPCKIYRIGIADEFGQSGSSDDLIKFYGLDSDSITKKIQTICQKELYKND